MDGAFLNIKLTKKQNSMKLLLDDIIDVKCRNDKSISDPKHGVLVMTIEGKEYYLVICLLNITYKATENRMHQQRRCVPK